MNKIKYLLLIGILSLLCISCEETVDGGDMPYVEQIVIQGIIEAGQPIDSISITRTLSPLENEETNYYGNGGYQPPEKALIKDASVTITCDNQVYNMSYLKNSYYNENSGLIAQPGKTYNITVKWHGKTAYASTFIPNSINIETIVRNSIKIKNNTYDYEVVSYDAVFSSNQENVVYRGFVFYQFNVYKQRGYSLTLANEKGSDGKYHVHVLVASYYSGGSNTTYYGGVEIYDAKFYDLFDTRYNGESNLDVFGFSGNNIKGNVGGDGIGYFIGRNVSDTKTFIFY